MRNEINLLDLPGVEFYKREELPTIPGVYFVMQYDEVLYVGQSINIRERWRGHGHHKCVEVESMENIFIRYAPSDGRKLLIQEAEWISELRPLLNGNVSKIIRISANPKKLILPRNIARFQLNFIVVGQLIICMLLILAFFIISGSVYEKIDALGKAYVFLILPLITFSAGSYLTIRSASNEIDKHNELTEYIYRNGL